MPEEPAKKSVLKRISGLFGAAFENSTLQVFWVGAAAVIAYFNTLFISYPAPVSIFYPSRTVFIDGGFSPLAALSLQLTGERAFAGHFMNLVFYASACLAAYWVLKLLFREGLIPFFAALVFAVHPIHADAVAQISGRGDLLGGLFVLLAWAFYLLGREKQAASGEKFPVFYTAAGCASFFLALLSTPNAWAFLLLAAGGEIIKSLPEDKFDFKGILRLLTPQLAILGAFLLLRVIFTGDVEGPASSLNPLTGEGIMTRLATTLVFAGEAVYILFAPLRLSFAHEYSAMEPIKILSPAGLTAILLWAAALFALFLAARKWRVIGIAALFFLAAYIPVSNLLYTVTYAFAEKYLFLAALLPATAYGAVIAAVTSEKTRTAAAVALAALAVFFAALSFMRGFAYF